MALDVIRVFYNHAGKKYNNYSHFFVVPFVRIGELRDDSNYIRIEHLICFSS